MCHVSCVSSYVAKGFTKNQLRSINVKYPQLSHLLSSISAQKTESEIQNINWTRTTGAIYKSRKTTKKIRPRDSTNELTNWCCFTHENWIQLHTWWQSGAFFPYKKSLEAHFIQLISVFIWKETENLWHFKVFRASSRSDKCLPNIYHVVYLSAQTFVNMKKRNPQVKGRTNEDKKKMRIV